MAEETTRSPEMPAAEPAAVFTEEQRGVFRSAGTWMMVMGWVEVLAGILLATLGLLSWWKVVPAGEVLPTTLDRATWWGQAAFTVSIGVLTLLAARSFRRAAIDTGRGFGAVTEAVARLRELYERQVLFGVFIFVALVLLGLFGG